MIKKSIFGTTTLLVDLLIAILGTVELQSPFTRFFRQSAKAVVLRDNFLSIAIAFGLGYFVFSMWQHSTAKWVWITGLSWFSVGAIRIWLTQGDLRLLTGSRGTIYWEMSGVGCMFQLNSCWNWIEYTLPLLRTTFYSAGAFCSLRFGSRSTHWRPSDH